MSEPDLILASGSPRRRELLERAGLVLRVEPVDIDEAIHAGERPRDYVARLAAEKCAAAVARFGGPNLPAGANLTGVSNLPQLPVLPILAADTTVVLGAEIFGKPSGPDDAAGMLRRLAGRRHEVMTGYRVQHGDKQVERVVTTAVSFRLLEPAEIEAYVASREWEGKAGGYAIQGIAALFATELRGSLTNVIGLPLAEVIADLRAVGALTSYPAPAFGVRA